jgi:Mor family transcriptional regulator
MKSVGIDIPCITQENKKSFFVYGIKNKVTNKYYIGSCTNKRGILDRFRRHIYYLRLGNHHSEKLQRSFNKYNKNFNYWEFILFELITIDNYKYREQYYIDKYNAYYDGYNTSPIVGIIHHGKMNDNHKNSISKAKQNLSELDVINIFKKYNAGLNYNQISKYYNITPQTISKVINKPHYYPEIKEKYSLIKKWYTYIFYNKEKNKFYRVNNFTEFCNKNNINGKIMMQLMLRKYKKTFVKNWTVFKRNNFSLGELKKRIKIDNKKHILYKNNIKYEFKSVRNFCKQYKLDETSVYHLINGNKNHVKGFTLYNNF